MEKKILSYLAVLFTIGNNTFPNSRYNTAYSYTAY